MAPFKNLFQKESIDIQSTVCADVFDTFRIYTPPATSINFVHDNQKILRQVLGDAFIDIAVFMRYLQNADTAL